MTRVIIFLKEVALPIAMAIILAAVFRNIYVTEDGCRFYALWLLVGFPFGIGRIRHLIVPVRGDLGFTVAVWFLNVLIAGAIGGVVFVWHIVIDPV
jgi:hypothetical protein